MLSVRSLQLVLGCDSNTRDRRLSQEKKESIKRQMKKVMVQSWVLLLCTKLKTKDLGLGLGRLCVCVCKRQTKTDTQTQAQTQAHTHLPVKLFVAEWRPKAPGIYLCVGVCVCVRAWARGRVCGCVRARVRSCIGVF